MVEHTLDESPPAASGASPPPDALAPEALRTELINIVRNSWGRPTGTNRNEFIVDNILAKLAQYYAAAATPEMTAEAPQTFVIIQELAHGVDRIISAGSTMSNDAQPSDVRQRWAASAIALREAWNRFLATLT